MRSIIVCLLPFGLVNWYTNRKRKTLVDKYVNQRRQNLNELRSQLNETATTGNFMNFGCGKNYQKGWINIDGENNGDFNIFFTTQTILPFESSTFDGIFSEHFIEHIDLSTGVHFMQESFRLLKPGGVLRVVCPNLDYIILGIDADKMLKLKEMFVGVGDFNRAPSEIPDAEVINWMFYGHGHKFLYNFACMRNILLSIGFSSVELSKFGSSYSPQMAIERRKDESFYSLFVDAVK